MEPHTLIGRWESHYTYADGKSSRHIVEISVDDAMIMAQSIPQEDGSELQLTLHYGGDGTLTGFWDEDTAPGGEYSGTAFHGALQLILNDAGDEAEGAWVGHDSNFSKVNSGAWRLVRHAE